MQVAKKAGSEFAPHQKAVADLLPRLQKAQKGEAVEFSEAEKATLQAASKAGEKLLALSGIFPVAIAEQLKTMTQAVKVVMQANSAPTAKPEILTEEAALLATADMSKSPYFLRDQNGKLIVLINSKPILKILETGGSYPEPSNGRMCRVVVDVHMQPAYIFSNQGKKIPVEIFIKVENPKPYYKDDNSPAPPLSKENAVAILELLHFKANCHGETFAQGELNIYSNDISQMFSDPKEFGAWNAKCDIVTFSDDKGNVQHSAKYDPKTGKYRYDDGQHFPKEGTLEDARSGEKRDGTKFIKYKNPNIVHEIEKRVPQDKGNTKDYDHIRVIDKEQDIRKK